MQFDWKELLIGIGFILETGVVGVLWQMYREYQKNEARKAEERANQDKAMRDAMCSILRTDIFRICLKAESRGYIPLYDVENLSKMLPCYKALGGNGTAERLCEQALNLPHTDKE